MLTTSVQKVHLPIKVIIPRIVTNLEVKRFCYPALGKSSYSAQGYYGASYFQRHFMSIGSAIVVVIRVRHQYGGQSGLPLNVFFLRFWLAPFHILSIFNPRH